MKVYCTRPCTHDQTEPHSTELAEEALLDREKNRQDATLCATCGMPLILNGRYVPIKKLGQGGFGYTFLALDLKFGLDSKRVIKQFRSDLLLSAGQMALAKKAFEREYKIQDQLKHPQIPRVYEPFDVEAPAQGNTNRTTYYYFVQEYIEGEDLQKKLKNRQQSNSTFSEVEVQDILKQVLEVLHYIHSFSPPIIHRDIKPSNIIQTVDGKCYLIDFGAVKQVLPVSDPSRQTTILGTPGYAPPEQFDGTVDFSSDLYALAKTCICLLTGSPSFSPPWGVSELLTNVLNKMISLDPQMRYRSTREVQDALVESNPKPLSSVTTNWWKWVAAITIGMTIIVAAITLGKFFYPRTVLKFKPEKDKYIRDVPAPSGTYYYGGSTTWVPLMDKLDGEMGENIRRIFRIERKTSQEELIGTTSGLKMLQSKVIDIALSSKEKEVSALNDSTFSRTTIAKSTVVMVVNKKSKIDSIEQDRFNDIKDGKVSDWKNIPGGKPSKIVLYATDNSYTNRKPEDFIKVKDASEGIKRIANDPGGAMIVPLQIAVDQCDCKTTKILEFRTANLETLNPYVSKCLEKPDRSKVNIDFIKKMPNTNILDLEIVFRNDTPKSEEAGKYLARVLMTQEGQEIVKNAGYLPISSLPD
jgi:serine/threonine protein kinase